MLNKAFHVLHLELTSQHLDIHITPSPCARLMALLATVAGCCGVLEFARLRKFKKWWNMGNGRVPPGASVPCIAALSCVIMVNVAIGTELLQLIWMFLPIRTQRLLILKMDQNRYLHRGEVVWLIILIPLPFKNRTRLCDFCPSSCAAGFLGTKTFVYCVKACWS